MTPRSGSKIPLPLFLALIAPVFGAVASAAVRLEAPQEVSLRWSMFDYGCAFVQACVLPYVLLTYAREVEPRARIAIRVAAGLFVVAGLWVVARPILMAVFGTGDTLWDVYRWGFRTYGIAMFGATLAFSLAASAWGHAPVSATFALLSTVAMGWLPGLDDKIWSFIFEHRTLGRIYWPAREIVWVLGMLGMAHALARRAAPAASDPALAIRGFRRGALGLAILIAGMLLGTAAVAIANDPTIKSLVIGGPALAIAGWLVCASALVDVMRARLGGVSALLLGLAVVAITWWCGVELEHVASRYAELEGTQSYVDHAIAIEAWALLGPFAAAVGLLLAAIAARAAHRSQPPTGAAHIALYATFSGIALWGHAFDDYGSIGAVAIGLSAAFAIAVIAALFRTLSHAIERAPGLPIARVRG